MNAKRGYDDKENLMRMAAGLDDGTFTSVHQAARFVLDEDGGPNVMRDRAIERLGSAYVLAQKV